MLENYTSITSNVVNQFILINENGLIIENDSIVFKDVIKKHIQELHPFFEIIPQLIIKKDETTLFKCVNINYNNTDYIVDVTLKIFKEDENALLIIDDLTRHYNNHQSVAQVRNESVINSQILSFKNQLLEKKEAFKNNFLTNFSHELRMPISHINDICEFIEDTELTQTQRYNLGIIKDTNSQLQYIINDILDISRIETGRFATQVNRFDLFSLLENANTIYSQKSQEKGLEFSYSAAKDCVQFFDGDEYRLKQILNNLIINAIKFTIDGGIKLKVSCTKKAKDLATLTFEVKDTGVGIEKDKLDSIFTSFYQIANKASNKGTGLGLAITKQLVSALNGTIDVKSTPNKGTSFIVTIDYGISENQTSDKKADTSKNLDLPKLLIADASVELHKELQNHLSNKYNVYFVTTGDSVIESLYRINYDLILLNVKLPTMDGIDTLRYIRFSENTTFEDIPIIMVSHDRNSTNKKSELNSSLFCFI